MSLWYRKALFELMYAYVKALNVCKKDTQDRNILVEKRPRCYIMVAIQQRK